MKQAFISDECTVGMIVRELMHTLGFIDEQNRPDRYKHVLINYDNVPKGKFVNTLLSLVKSKKIDLRLRFL